MDTPIVIQPDVHHLACRREHLVNWLPKKRVVAEIGVQQGNFSQLIFDRTQPTELHLIDPWEYQGHPGYQADPANCETVQHLQNLEIVHKRFSPSDNVFVHRAYSAQAAKWLTFEATPGSGPGYFDWIYLDGDHSFDGCTRDLEDWSQLVQHGGFILGHDYAQHEWAQRYGVEVVRAVDEFCLDWDWRILALTLEEWPTYILGRTESWRENELLMEVIGTGLKELHGCHVTNERE